MTLISRERSPDENPILYLETIKEEKEPADKEEQDYRGKRKSLLDGPKEISDDSSFSSVSQTDNDCCSSGEIRAGTEIRETKDQIADSESTKGCQSGS